MLAVVSAVLTLTGRESVSAQRAAGATEVTMKKTKFEPETLQAQAGETRQVLLKNSDPGFHTFTIKALGVDAVIGPGSEKLVEIAAAPGTYEYICTIAGHETMKGTLEVR